MHLLDHVAGLRVANGSFGRSRTSHIQAWKVWVHVPCRKSGEERSWQRGFPSNPEEITSGKHRLRPSRQSAASPDNYDTLERLLHILPVTDRLLDKP